MKVVVSAELIKSLNKKKDAAQLNYFKKELIKVLEKNDEEIVSKAIEDYDNSIKKTYSEIGIEKAGYGIGTVRVWKGQKFRKIAPGKWRRIYDSNTRGARQSINIIKKKIANAQSIDELLQLVMENTNRFMDADGKLLPIVEELQNAVKESRGRLNTGKPSTQEQIEQFKKENGKSEDERISDEIKEIDAAYNKTVHVDYDNSDYKTMKAIHDQATELYGNITKKLREAENEGDWNKSAAYERLKGELHPLLSRIQWRFNEVEKNYIKKDFFVGIENEKNVNRADIPDSENSAIVDFNNKINEFVNEHKNSTWAVYTNLITLMKNITDKKAAQRWCVINGISNFDELLKDVENRVKHKVNEEIKEKNRAAKVAREEKINKINEDNGLKTYSDEEVTKALEGVNSLMAERDTLKEKLKDVIKKENEARNKYHELLLNHDESRHEIWDEVLSYRKQANELAEERDSFEKKLDVFMGPIAYYYLRGYKYGKDEKINECKISEDVENLIKSKDWYSDEGNKRLDLKRMDVNAAKDVFKCMERLFAIFPEQKGRNISMKCEPCYKNWWAFARGGEITYNSKNYSDYSNFQDTYEGTEGSFHPKGTSAKDITYHEYYHVMTHGRLAKRIKQNVTKRLKMRGKKGGPKQDDIIKFGISEYATTDADEFGAECLQQALGSENPSAFAVEVFKETLKYKKYMRGMV